MTPKNHNQSFQKMYFRLYNILTIVVWVVVRVVPLLLNQTVLTPAAGASDVCTGADLKFDSTLKGLY